MPISSCHCIYGRESIRRESCSYIPTRKILPKKDGQVSALLHLDMEHLGPLDVYVALKDTKVSTKFYVQNDAILDYLEANMDVLTERLQKRRHMIVNVRQHCIPNYSRRRRPWHRFLRQKEVFPVAQYAFDVRT